jgi:hypothetical protein
MSKLFCKTERKDPPYYNSIRIKTKLIILSMFVGLREITVRDWDRRHEENIFYSILNSRTVNEACSDLFHIFQGLPLSRRPFGYIAEYVSVPFHQSFCSNGSSSSCWSSLGLYQWNFPFYPSSFAVRLK